MEKIIFFITICIITPLVKCLVPGTFFWKPRLALDLSLPTSEISVSGPPEPSWKNIRAGIVVIVEGYQMGMTTIVFAQTFSDTITYEHLNPSRAAFHNNIYRWGLRHLDLLPNWLGGRGKYSDTHKVWTRRFYYLDAFVPSWMQKLLFYVSKEDWDQDRKDYRRYVKYSEPSFGKHYRYPNNKFDNFKEFETKETSENLDGSSVSLSLKG